MPTTEDLDAFAASATEEQLAQFLTGSPEPPVLDKLFAALVTADRADLVAAHFAYSSPSLFTCSLALSDACARARPHLVQVLLSAPNAAINGVGMSASPLESAASAGSLACVEALLAGGANPNHVSGQPAPSGALLAEDGGSPLLNAIRAGSLEIVDRLVGAGVDVNRTTKADRRPLDVARALDRGEIVERLKASGAKGSSPDEADLDTAVARGYVDRVTQLLRKSPVDAKRLAALAFWAGRHGQMAVVERLASAHGSIDTASTVRSREPRTKAASSSSSRSSR